MIKQTMQKKDKDIKKSPLMFVLIGIVVLLIVVSSYFGYQYFWDNSEEESTNKEANPNKETNSNNDDGQNKRFGSVETGYISLPGDLKEKSRDISSSNSAIVLESLVEDGKKLGAYIRLDSSNEIDNISKALAEEKYEIENRNNQDKMYDIEEKTIKIKEYDAYLISKYYEYGGYPFEYYVFLDANDKQYQITIFGSEDLEEAISTFDFKE